LFYFEIFNFYWVYNLFLDYLITFLYGDWLDSGTFDFSESLLYFSLSICWFLHVDWNSSCVIYSWSLDYWNWGVKFFPGPLIVNSIGVLNLSRQVCSFNRASVHFGLWYISVMKSSWEAGSFISWNNWCINSVWQSC